MLKQLFILTAFGITIPNAVFSQKNNRISVQSGLFNCFFDGTPIVNSKPKQGDVVLGKWLIDSQGIELMRRIKKSQISFEYMRFHGSYNYTPNYGSAVAEPQYMWRDLKFVSGFYNRYLPLNEHWDFQYGIGATYSWGGALLYHYSFQNPGWSEAYVTSYSQKNINLNLKAGIEYTPIKWVTIYSNFNLFGSVYETNDIEPSHLYKDKYGMSNTPSRYSVSWRFGIGFNF